MKKLLAVTLLAALCASGPADARERYIGNFQIISKSGTCPSYDPTGDRLVARYRPPITGTDNGPDTKLGIFYQDGARGINVTGSVNIGPSAAFKAAQSVNVFEGWDTVTPVQQIRYISQSPATLATNTPYIAITGQINNYDFQAGCLITFRLLVQKFQADLP